jgi:hypothetical protein
MAILGMGLDWESLVHVRKDPTWSIVMESFCGALTRMPHKSSQFAALP